MVQCSQCQMAQVDNTLFCLECGSYLNGGNVTETNPVDTKSLSPYLYTLLNSNKRSELAVSSTSICLKIEHGRKIELLLHKPVHIGRLDPTANTFPEIDLTEDGGVQKGVSRRHARLIKRDGCIFIEDLGSANGTFVNNHPLPPYYTEMLSDGDQLRLGKLIIEVQFLR